MQINVFLWFLVSCSVKEEKSCLISELTLNSWSIAVNSCLEKWLGPFDSSFFSHSLCAWEKVVGMMGYRTEAEDMKSLCYFLIIYFGSRLVSLLVDSELTASLVKSRTLWSGNRVSVPTLSLIFTISKAQGEIYKRNCLATDIWACFVSGTNEWFLKEIQANICGTHIYSVACRVWGIGNHRYGRLGWCL